MRLSQGVKAISGRLGLALVIAGAGFAPAAAGGLYEQRPGDPAIVVELFTSQGCSSCPPADQLQVQLAERDDVLALTFPVDYWDYLGWRDTLARPQNAERQMAYAKRSKQGRVFTPQMIIDGTYSGVGGRREEILGKIAHRKEMKRNLVPIAMTVGGDQVTVIVPDAPDVLKTAEAERATLWFFPFTRIETVHIGNGENRGRTIRYAHVVRNVVELGEWRGKAARLSYDLGPYEKDLDGYAALLQEGEIGPIVGVAAAVRTNSGQPAMVAPEPPIGSDPLAVNLPR